MMLIFDPCFCIGGWKSYMHTLLMSLRGDVEDSRKVGWNKRRSDYLTYFLQPYLPVSKATPPACER